MVGGENVEEKMTGGRWAKKVVLAHFHNDAW